MNDSNFIEEIARKWVELGGDSEGVAWSWKRLQEAVINIEYAQQSVQADECPVCSGLGDIVKNESIEECPECDGTGIRR
jgi:hypothetical protein